MTVRASGEARRLLLVELAAGREPEPEPDTPGGWRRRAEGRLRDAYAASAAGQPRAADLRRRGGGRVRRVSELERELEPDREAPRPGMVAVPEHSTEGK